MIYFGSSGVTYTAGSGNETLNAAGSSSDNQIFAGNGNDSLVGGSGNDRLTAGTGSATMSGGSGFSVFVFLNGQAGGNDVITDFNSNDLLLLGGYGISAGTNAINSATVGGGSTTIALPDNTRITFENITNPAAINVFSLLT